MGRRGAELRHVRQPVYLLIMAIAGSLIGKAIGAFGKKPKVPTLAAISPDATQKATVGGNIANFADIARLATEVNTFSQEQLESLIDRVLPTARQQIEKNISSQLRGEIPDDVRRAIAQGNSERFVGAFSGSDFVRSNEAKQLGLTSLGIINQGLSSAESWLSKATAPQFDVTSMFFTPQQRLSFEVQQQGAKFQRDLMAAQVKAAPDPATAALGTEIDRFFNTAAGAGLMAAGGGFGGGGAAAGAGGGGFGGTGSFSNMGLAGGQGVGVGQSSLGNFWGNWNQKYGF